MKLQTVSVYKSCRGGWIKSVFGKAFVRYSSGLGFERGGRHKKSKMTARIFSPSARAITVGDMIELGCGGNKPSEKALTVTEISDNLDFSPAHIRITAI